MKPTRRYVFSFLALVALFISVFSTGVVSASRHSQGLSIGHVNGSSTPITTPVLAKHEVIMQNVPGETSQEAHQPSRAIPLLRGMSPEAYAKAKATALYNPHAPTGSHAYTPLQTPSHYTPGVSTAFQGMADSGSICPNSGCQPPDQALAASTSWVMQGVNTSFAVYNTNGAVQAGWPKNAQNFFNIPSPGNCDPSPFTSDPRAFYDPVDGRFWVAMLQVEGAFGLNNCPLQSLYWIAVSTTNNPNGPWCTYAYNMTPPSTTNVADFTQFGFDGQAVYFSGNMFNQAGSAYQYAEIFGVNKALLESPTCPGATAYGFDNLSVSSNRTVLVDTVQPVEAQARRYTGPDAGLFINSFNINGDPYSETNCASMACHGLAIWALAKPGTPFTTLSAKLVDTTPYTLAPMAEQPNCIDANACIDTGDTRISATPSYHNGMISFALDTAHQNNQGNNVASIYWGQVAPQLNDNGSLAGASVYQQGYLYYNWKLAAAYGALMPDADGDLFMVFEYLGRWSYPTVGYITRRVAYPLGSFHDSGLGLMWGSTNTFDSRWGDYEATSYDGYTSDNVWFSGEYSASSGDWSTYIGKDRFTCLSCN